MAEQEEETRENSCAVDISTLSNNSAERAHEDNIAGYSSGPLRLFNYIVVRERATGPCACLRGLRMILDDSATVDLHVGKAHIPSDTYVNQQHAGIFFKWIYAGTLELTHVSAIHILFAD